MWRGLTAVLVASFCVAGCSGGSRSPSTEVTAAPTVEPTEAPETTAVLPDAPVRKTYARGETVDIPRGILFLNPKTGGGEAWADVRSSPSGMYVAWNGADGKQQPVLFETDTYRQIPLDTGGAFGTVLDFAPDDSEVSVKVGDEFLIASTETGAVRLRFQLDPTAIYARASWGPNGAVAVTTAGRDNRSLGIQAWSNGALKTFPGTPFNWAQWSPDGTTILSSQIDHGVLPGFTALIDFAAGRVARLEHALYNPRWSESGAYFEGQLFSGELLIFRADGTPQMRMNGVCALLGTPWIGDEIATWGFGQDVRVAMDGSVTPYTPAAHSGPSANLAGDGRVELLERWPNGRVLAELRPKSGASFFSSSEGVVSVTTDGRGMYSLGSGGKGFCENVGNFKVKLAPFE